MKKSFLDEVAERVIVCDGAMGTLLYSKGIFINRCFDALNLTQPTLVAEVHQEYVRAGAEVIETNTFGANRVKLRAFGLADRLHAINVEGVRLARHSGRHDAWVAGAIGPLGIRIEPWGKTGVDEAEGHFREQVQALVEGGVDLFILETFRDLNEISAAVRAVRACSPLPIVAQMTTEEDGNSLDGTPPEVFAPALEQLGASIVGLNCSIGPAPMLEGLERMAAATRLKLAAQPNAGKPRDIEGRNIYLCSPEYMASYARRFIATQVRLVGGCCGTTPEHIRQIALAVKATAPAMARAHAASNALRGAVTVADGVPPVSRAEKSHLARTLADGRFAVVVEIRPPKGHDPAEAIVQARALKARGVDAAIVPDGPRAGARMSGLSVAALVQQHAGLETVLQYSCRDRNLLGMQSDLLGAHAMGLRNLLIVTGDPRTVGDYPDATAVFDVDSIGLTNVVSRLNQGLDIGGQAIGRPTAFHIGVMANPGSLDLDDQLRRFEWKVEAGAEFVLTMPVFDLGPFERFVSRIAHAKLPIIAAVWPFESVLNAEFMANEVPGVQVPEPVLERMRRAEGGSHAAAEGIAIAREMAAGLKDLVQGVYVATPSGRLDEALAVLDAVV